MFNISIITVNKNNVEELSHTIESVIRYAPSNSEYIVIDGASTDGSCELIQCSSRIDKYISEPDAGIYCAMNKGIKLSTGDYCLFLNSGDVLHEDNGLGELTCAEEDVLYSDAIVVQAGCQKVIRYPEKIDVNFFISGMINHQNTLIKRELFSRVGLYNENMLICADWLFFLRAAYICNAKYLHLKKTIVQYSIDGISSQPGSDTIKEEEMTAGVQMVFGDLAPSIIELRQYRKSIYGNIVGRYGSSSFLDFVLRCYRFLARLQKSN